MLNTIILIIIGIVFAIYVMRTVNGIDNNNFHFSDLLIAILCLGIIINAHSNANNNSKVAEAYNNGYNSAIQSAELIEMTEDSYFIDFGTSVHEYSFED